MMTQTIHDTCSGTIRLKTAEVTRRIYLAALWAWLLVVGTGVQAGTATVAISNTPAPGTPAGVSYSTFSGPRLNDAGQVAFRAQLTGAGISTTNDFGIWRGGAGSIALVAQEGGAAPGTAAGVSYSVLQLPLLNNSGQVAFESEIAGTGVTTSNNSGIWVGALGAVQLAAREGSNAPGTPAGVNFSVFFSPELNNIGQVAFAATLTGSGVSSTNNEGIWRGAAGAVERVVREGDFAPGIIFGSVGNTVALNDAGQVAHYGLLTGQGVDLNNDEALWRGAPGALQPVVREGSQPPGTPTGTRFTNLAFTRVLNDAGQIAFSSDVDGDTIDSTNYTGIWRGAPNAVQLVARAGNSAPGTPAGVVFTPALNTPTLNDRGQVAFWGGLTGAGIFFDHGIWRGSPGALQLIARVGQTVSGLPLGVTPSSLNAPALNDAGQVAFSAVLTGAGIDETNNLAYYLGDGEELVQVARRGQPLAGSTIFSISTAGTENGFNAFGQFAYTATLTDGRQAVAVFTPDLHWRRNIGGSWDTANNWTVSIPPGAPHDVTIDPAASLTVLGPTGHVGLKSLTIGGGTGVATLKLQQGGGITTPSQVLVGETGVLTGDGTITGGVSNAGTVSADNLTIQGGRLTNGGVVTGNGRINGALFNLAGGEVRVAADQHLHFTGPEGHDNFGRIEVIDGEAEFDSLLFNEAGGLITARNARLRFNGILSNFGTMGLSFGTSDVFGRIENSGGKFILSGGSNATFYDDVVNNGELRTSAGSTAVYFGRVSGAGTFTGTGKSFFEGTFSPGNSPAAVNIEGDVAMGPAATMLLEIGGATEGLLYDHLGIGGVLDAAGDLEVSLLGGFEPSFGESFDLLSFGSRRGWFDDVKLPNLADGLSWQTTLSDQRFSLSVVPEPATVVLCAIGGLLLLLNRQLQPARACIRLWFKTVR